MKNRRKKVTNIILAVIFLAIICTYAVKNCSLIISLSKQLIARDISTETFEASFSANFADNMKFVDFNGLLSRAMNQKIENEVVRGSNNKLYLMDELQLKVVKSEQKDSADNVLTIYKYAKKKGINVIYASEPEKFTEGVDTLPYGYEMQWNKILDYRIKYLKGKMPTVNLETKLGKHKQFYKTDHHWTVETSFYAAKVILGKFNVSTKYLSRNKFTSETYKNSFLGSSGIRTGKYYVGWDDFTMLYPKYSTNLMFEHFIDNKLTLRKSGSFKSALVDNKILADKSYYNKYNACLNGGYVETRIVNRKIDSNRKVLIISDSFSRPMTQYISLCYKETRYLDPQKGRYNSNYLNYINKYKPDDIIIMCFVPINVK